MARLSNKHVLVAGAESGIGRATMQHPFVAGTTVTVTEVVEDGPVQIQRCLLANSRQYRSIRFDRPDKHARANAAPENDDAAVVSIF